MAEPDRIRVEGLDEFRKELRKLSKDLPKALGRANNQAADIVANEARATAAGLGSTIAKAGPSIRALKSASKAQVAMGGARYPYAMGAEFGSNRYKQFPSPVRGGRSLYPAIKEKRTEVMDRYADLILDNIAKEAFPD